MKDEIKEILNYLKENDDKDIFGYVKDKILSYEEAQLLLDYITNLQEELERCVKANVILDDENAELQGKIYDLQEENDRLKELNVCVGCNNNPDYKQRNEKAIEYIKQNSKCGGSFIDDKFVIEYIDEIFNGMELLNILNGGDE